MLHANAFIAVNRYHDEEVLSCPLWVISALEVSGGFANAQKSTNELTILSDVLRGITERVATSVKQEITTLTKQSENQQISIKEMEESALEEYISASVSTINIDIAHKPSQFYYFSKRLIDLVLATLGLIILLPVFFIIAVCIKLTDGGDVLYFREVIGQHGKRFFALKFRTMIADADDYLEKHPELMRKYHQNMKLTEDPRITPIGRFLRRASLDELPQLVNVLLGQMSLVGPRIIHPSELPRYGKFAQKRLSTLPGITGLWQISGRQHISYNERVLLDMRYLDTRSCLGDLKLLIKTLKVLIIHTGA